MWSPAQGPYDVIDTLVPGNGVDLLAAIYIYMVVPNSLK